MSENTKSTGAGRFVKIGCLSVAAVVGGLIVIGALVGDSEDQTALASSPTTNSQEPVQAAAEKISKADGLTGPQENARRSAIQYLEMSGFSRDGLIDQLSSDAGNGYEVADATAAVDSLDVNWNEQAARSAKQYLDMTGFSCKGLIEQLSSDAGNKYTRSQATYGAEQAGAC